MRCIAATVIIVTADDGERYHGMTATAVTSLCMEPPSLLVCVNQKAFLHDMLLRAANFCVNVLHQVMPNCRQPCSEHQRERQVKIGRLNALSLFKLQDNVTFSHMKRALA
jgi:flavin reductase (DIM6/NTAB) family NADH-FMN oxidoreductase RutF